MFKRGVGIILSLCLSLFFAEVAIADVHDGDASASELAALAPSASDATADVSPAVSERAAPGSPVVQTVEQSAQQQTHEHACHCLHAHNGWTISPPVQTPPLLVSQTRLMDGVMAPTQNCVDVEYRPPITSA